MNKEKILKKVKLYGILTLVVIIIAGILYFVFKGTKGLDKPESIVYDEPNDRYLISNSGNGSIVSMNAKGKIQTLIDKGLTNPKGLYLNHPFLFVADVTSLQAIDLMNKRVVATYPIDGAMELNDIAADGGGNLYITDTGANCLFIFNPDTKALQKISHPLLNSPKGIIYDRPRHQMMIVGFGNHSSILIYDIRNQEVSIFQETVYSQLDGIAIDELGRIYFSSWKEKMIVMIPQEQNRFIPLVRNLTTPADFIYNERTKELLIPLVNKNKIHRHDL